MQGNGESVLLVDLCITTSLQIDEDLAKINIDDPKYRQDAEDGIGSRVRYTSLFLPLRGCNPCEEGRDVSVH